MSKNSLSHEEKTEVISSYLGGESFTSLSKRFSVPTAIIKKVIDNPEARLLIEKKNFELSRARETARIDEIKTQMLDFISSSLQEALTEERKIVFLDKIKGMLDSLDRIARLNRGELTDNTQHTEKKVTIDVAGIIKELDTPEKKKEFLRRQLLVSPDAEQ